MPIVRLLGPLRLCRVGLLVLAGLWAGAAFADAVPAPAPANGAALDPAMAARIRRLETELRCLVCQNQTLADSNAGLAEDLRREVRELALAGKSDDEIKSYLHDRYGDFIFYKPPLKPETWFLWFGPFLLLVAAFAGLARWVVRHRGAARPPPDPEQLRLAEELLRDG